MMSYKQIIVLVLSLLLVVAISVTSFQGIAFTDSEFFMRVQLVVCLAFLAEFFHDVWLSRPHCMRYFVRHIAFFLIAIPYLSIITALNLDVHPEVMEYLKYIPIIRGAYVMVMLINYVSTSRIMGIFMSYLSIIVLMLYFSSVIFYVREHAVNAQISSYLTSLWWCCLQFTTIGAPIDPVTPTGKVLAAILAAMGVIMFPLFTVYLIDSLRRRFTADAK